MARTEAPTLQQYENADFNITYDRSMNCTGNVMPNRTDKGLVKYEDMAFLIAGVKLRKGLSAYAPIDTAAGNLSTILDQDLTLEKHRQAIVKLWDVCGDKTTLTLPAIVRKVEGTFTSPNEMITLATDALKTEMLFRLNEDRMPHICRCSNFRYTKDAQGRGCPVRRTWSLLAQDAQPNVGYMFEDIQQEDVCIAANGMILNSGNGHFEHWYSNAPSHGGTGGSTVVETKTDFTPLTYYYSSRDFQNQYWFKYVTKWALYSPFIRYKVKEVQNFNTGGRLVRTYSDMAYGWLKITDWIDYTYDGHTISVDAMKNLMSLTTGWNMWDPEPLYSVPSGVQESHGAVVRFITSPFAYVTFDLTA